MDGMRQATTLHIILGMESLVAICGDALTTNLFVSKEFAITLYPSEKTI
jgi:hypothetical protein